MCFYLFAVPLFFFFKPFPSSVVVAESSPFFPLPFFTSSPLPPLWTSLCILICTTKEIDKRWRMLIPVANSLLLFHHVEFQPNVFFANPHMRDLDSVLFPSLGDSVVAAACV